MSRSSCQFTRFISTMAVTATAAMASSLHAQTVDFEDVALAPGEMLAAAPVVESRGMRFFAPSFMMLQHNRFAMGANDSTTLWGRVLPIMMSSVDGQAFDLVSVDLGEMNSMFSAQSVRVTGYYEGGGLVTQDIVLDQVYDGPGGVDDLQTYAMGSEWTGLREVQFVGLSPMGPFFADYVLDQVVLGSEVADSDGDGVPDDQDACPESDMRSTIHVGNFDTDVANMLFDDGCTMADMIAAAMDGAKNHGKAVSAVTQLANQWKMQGLISGKDKGKITSAAAKSK